jgi:hypothetical protein
VVAVAQKPRQSPIGTTIPVECVPTVALTTDSDTGCSM